MIHEAFQKLKSNLELDDSFDELIQTRHNAIRSVIENNGHDVETKLIGSLQRQTKIQPEAGGDFDIDVLVVLGSFFSWLPIGSVEGVTPQAAMEKLTQIVGESDRYGAMNPRQDQPTVSFEYHDDTKVELVPAYLDQIGASPNGVRHTPVGRAYWVPKNGGWVLSDYDHEADHITAQNAATDGLLVPTIKMLKAIKRKHFPDMKSFHLEVAAAQLIPALVAVNRQYNIRSSFDSLIIDFFNHAPTFLNDPVKIPGSNSPHCDFDGMTKATVMARLDGIKSHCNNIRSMTSDTAKMKAWRELFGEVFPAHATV